MSTKLLENVDDETWNKTVGLSKIKGMFIGEYINIILRKNLEDEGIIEKSKEAKK